MAEAGFGAARQYQSIEEDERPLVLKDLAGQEQIDLAMGCLRSGHDLQSTPLVRDAGDLPAVAEESGTVVIRPHDLHGLAFLGGVTRYGHPTICSHGFSSALRSGGSGSRARAAPGPAMGPAHRAVRRATPKRTPWPPVPTVNAGLERVSMDPIQEHHPLSPCPFNPPHPSPPPPQLSHA